MFSLSSDIVSADAPIAENSLMNDTSSSPDSLASPAPMLLSSAPRETVPLSPDRDRNETPDFGCRKGLSELPKEIIAYFNKLRLDFIHETRFQWVESSPNNG